MISETATELIKANDYTAFWIAVAILIALFIAAVLKKSVYV
jgi:hypothetical protein